MIDRYKILICFLTIGAVFLVVVNRSWPNGTAAVQAAGWQNLAFIDEAGEQAFENFSKIATLHGTLFKGIDKAKVFSKREHKVWDVESNLYLASMRRPSFVKQRGACFLGPTFHNESGSMSPGFHSHSD